MSNSEHLNTKMISLDNLILAIEELDNKGIISFEDFQKLSYSEIQKKYFLMPQYKTLLKAYTKIQDKKDGKIGPSIFQTKTTTMKNGRTTIEVKTEYF